MSPAKPIKVLHIIYALDGGGAEAQLRLLATHGSDYGIDSYIFCVDSTKIETLAGLSNNVVVHQRKSKLDLSLFGSMRSAIKRIQPDLIQAWLPEVITIPAMMLALLYGIPLIFCYRNRMQFHRTLSYAECLLAAVSATRVVSNNPISQSALPYRWLYRSKSGRTIPNAVALCAHPKTSLARSNDDVLSLLFVGRMVPEKNILGLIRALSLIESTRNWRLDIYGSGHIEGEVRQLIDELGFAERIILRGYHPRIHEVMTTADVLVFPSLYEGMPNVLLEAFSCRLPVIASRIPACTELLQTTDCVAWIDPTNLRDMAAKLTDVLEERIDWREKVDTAYRFAEQFSPERMTQSYAAVYGELLGRKAASTTNTHG